MQILKPGLRDPDGILSIFFFEMFEILILISLRNNHDPPLRDGEIDVTSPFEYNGYQVCDRKCPEMDSQLIRLPERKSDITSYQLYHIITSHHIIQHMFSHLISYYVSYFYFHMVGFRFKKCFSPFLVILFIILSTWICLNVTFYWAAKRKPLRLS